MLESNPSKVSADLSFSSQRLNVRVLTVVYKVKDTIYMKKKVININEKYHLRVSPNAQTQNA